MTSEQQVQSNNMYQINNGIDYNLNEKHINHKKSIENFKIRSTSLFIDNYDENNFSINHDDILKKSSIVPRSSLPIIYSNYERKKSHSIKLTRIEQNGSYPKKAVRFADDFGLNLSQIKMIKTDELPYIPSIAFKYLHIDNDENSSTLFNHEYRTIIIYMEPQFENPIYTYNFIDRVSRQKVVLEQANAIDNQIYGTIRLISFGLHKYVKIRLTTDNWLSFKDYQAIYIINSYDGIYDRFSFQLEIDRHKIYHENNIQFSICYEPSGGHEYWDNNYQQNYRFNCFSKTISN